MNKALAYIKGQVDIRNILSGTACGVSLLCFYLLYKTTELACDIAGSLLYFSNVVGYAFHVAFGGN